MRIAIAVVVSLIGCGREAEPVLDDAHGDLVIARTDAPGSIDELKRRIAAVLERTGVPGVGLALVEGDRVWAGGVGVADVATRAPMDGDTVVRAASITKMIVGLGVMRLAEQGRLALDAPVGDVDNAWDTPVTLAQALEHTAGLDDMRPNEVFVDDDAMTPAAALAINPRSRVIRWEPGTRAAYSNVGYTLAAAAIERATGEPFDAWLAREVLRPLGMRDADFRRTDVLAARLAQGYSGPDHPARFRPIAHRGAGALLVSARELAQVVRLFLRDGGVPPVVSRAGLERIERTGTLPYHTDVDYGLGNYGDVGHPVRCRGHDGGLPGFASSLRYFPELGVGYVILLNATHSATAYVAIRSLVFAYLARHRVSPRVDDDRSAAPPDGFYAFANPRHELFGFLDRALIGWRASPIEAGVRLVPLVGNRLDLVATADGGYRLVGQSGTSLRFTTDRDGAPVMVGMLGYYEAHPWWPARVGAIAFVAATIVLGLAPWWAALAIVVALVRRRARALGLALWPALACVSLSAAVALFQLAALDQVLGEVHPWTVGVCLATIAFAAASLAGLVSAVRWSTRPDRPHVVLRLLPSLASLAGVGLAAWLATHGIIGLRTWAW